MTIKHHTARTTAAERALARAGWGVGMFVLPLVLTLASSAARLNLHPAEAALMFALLPAGAALGASASTPLVREQSRTTLLAAPLVASGALIVSILEPRLAWPAALLIGVAAALTLTALARQLEWDAHAHTRMRFRIRLAAGALLPAVAVQFVPSVVGVLIVFAVGSAVAICLAAIPLDELPATAWRHLRWGRRVALYGSTLPLAAVLFSAGAVLRAELVAFPELASWGLLGLVLVLAFPRPPARMVAHARPRVMCAVLGCQVVAVALTCLALASDQWPRALLWCAVVALIVLSLVPARGMAIDAARNGAAGMTSWLVLAGCLGYAAGPLLLGTPMTGYAWQYLVLLGGAPIVVGCAMTATVAVVKAQP